MGAQFSITTGSITLTASATKSLILLNPVTNRFVLTQFSVSLNGSAAAQAVQIDLYRVNSLGSPAGTTGTENATNPEIAQAATTTSLTALSTEPTSVFVLDSWDVQPFGGILVVQYPLGREPVAVGAGSRIGFRYTTASAVSPGCLATAWGEEG